MNNNILIAAGGTGGHIFPSIVFGKKFIDEGKNVKWICGSRSLEREIYNSSGINPEIIPLKGSPLGTKSIIENSKRFTALIKSFKQINTLIKTFKPDEIFLFGGYISFMPLLIGKFHKIPVTLHEQNAVSGKVTRLASKLGAKIITGWPECEGIKNFEYFGIPVREPVKIQRMEALKNLGLTVFKDSKIIGVTGGSLGSDPLSKLIIETSKICTEFEFVILSHDDFNDDNRHFIKPQWNMNPFFSICDILVCRAGGSTLSEALKWNLNTITVPWPNAADNHQEKNAQEFIKLSKSGKIFHENDTPENLAKIIRAFYS